MEVVPFALPAAAAGLAYANARFALSYDWGLLSSVVTSSIAARRHEKNDDINAFYFLENLARGTRAQHPWIIYNGKSWTYVEAYNLILKYGTWLKSKGVKKNEVVAIDFVNSEFFIWVWFGLWAIGAKPAFINYNLTGKPLLHTIRTSTARLVIVDEENKDNFAEDVMAENGFVMRSTGAQSHAGQQAHFAEESGASEKRDNPKASVARLQHAVETEPQPKRLEIVTFDQALQSRIESLQGVREPDEIRSGERLHNMAILIYTSGTTGLPKPAVVSWGKACLGGGFVARWVPIRNTDIIYTSMPLYHSSASILGVSATLRAGSTICLGKKFSHKSFWPEVRASKATIIHYVGETCRYLLAAPPSPQDKEHNVRVAYGNGLRPDVWNPFKERFGVETVCEFYAATEAPSGMWNRSTNNFSAGAIGRNGSLASLLFGPKLCIVRMDPESEPPEPLRDASTGLCQIVNVNEPGELFYKLDPANVQEKFQGYFGNDKATSSKIVRNVKVLGDAYFRTGDLLRSDAEGRWWFMDRTGDTFRWKAENVSTAEVGEVVGKHDAVEEGNVYGVLVPGHDGRAGCAAVVLRGTEKDGSTRLPDAATLRSLAEHLSKGLPRFAVPLFLRITKSMQTTGTNKHQKHVLQKEGINVEDVELTGDALYWLKDGTYERFTHRDLARIEGGQVRL